MRAQPRLQNRGDRTEGAVNERVQLKRAAVLALPRLLGGGEIDDVGYSAC